MMKFKQISFDNTNNFKFIYKFIFIDLTIKPLFEQLLKQGNKKFILSNMFYYCSER